MRTSKMSLAVMLALAVTLVVAASSWARPFGGPMHCGMMGAMNLTPEQTGKLFDLKEKFRTDTAEARKQMIMKHAELAALWKAEQPDEKAITAKQKELNTLRGQMIEKSVAFRLEARKTAPQLARAFGHDCWGMDGPRGFMGPGCPPMGPQGGPVPAKPAK